MGILSAACCFFLVFACFPSFGGVFVLFDTVRTMMGMVLFLALAALIYLYFLPGRDR